MGWLQVDPALEVPTQAHSCDGPSGLLFFMGQVGRAIFQQVKLKPSTIRQAGRPKIGRADWAIYSDQVGWAIQVGEVHYLTAPENYVTKGKIGVRCHYIHFQYFDYASPQIR